jgi:hypothetical protein
MAAKRTTPSMGRMLAPLAGTAGIGFGSTAVTQRHGDDVAQRSVRVRAVAQRAASPVEVRTVLKPEAKAKPHRSPVSAREPHRASSPTASNAPAPASAPTPVPATAPTQASAQPSAPTLRGTRAGSTVRATPAPAPVVSGGS